ncbi:GSCOCG00010799001-RA-CDS [Cotesia congregata]|nr:GSCOCG00010799001-RA-CDS [Cotesia congregata]
MQILKNFCQNRVTNPLKIEILQPLITLVILMKNLLKLLMSLLMKNLLKPLMSFVNEKSIETTDVSVDNDDDYAGNVVQGEKSRLSPANDAIKSKSNCVRCAKTLQDSDSFLVDESDDAYSKHRLCSQCNKLGSLDTKEMLGKREFENWRGQGQPPKKKNSRSLYIGTKSKNVKEMLEHKKCKGLPILKRGDSKDLKAIKINNRWISLYNTCPFDSLFQLMLVAACDFPVINTKIATEKNNSLYEAVHDALQKTISTKTYRTRAKILLTHFKVLKSVNNVDFVTCETSVGSFAAKLFNNQSSYEETLDCPRGCASRTISLPVISIKDDSLNKLENVFADNIQKSYRCNGDKCNRKTTKNSIIIGDIVLFEPYIQSGATVMRRLEELRKEYVRPTDGKKMKLVGLVHFYPPTLSREGIETRKKTKSKNQD